MQAVEQLAAELQEAAGRVFKEWVSVPEPDRRRWRELLREAVVFVAGGGA